MRYLNGKKLTETTSELAELGRFAEGAPCGTSREHVGFLRDAATSCTSRDKLNTTFRCLNTKYAGRLPWKSSAHPDHAVKADRDAPFALTTSLFPSEARTIYCVVGGGTTMISWMNQSSLNYPASK